MIRPRVVFTVVFGFILFITVSSLNAQLNVMVSPLSLEAMVAPGGRERLIVNLMNEGSRPSTFDIRLIDIFQDPSSGNFQPVTGEPEDLPPFSAAPWVSLRDRRITLAPGERRPVELQLRIPPAAVPGTYTAGILFEPAPEERDREISGDAVIRVQGMAMPILFLQVGRRGVLQTRSGRYGEIERFEVTETGRGLEFSALLANLGRNQLFARGRLTVFRDEARTLDIPLGRGTGRVLPGQKVSFKQIVPPPYPPGTYRAVAMIDYGGIRSAVAEFTFTVEPEALTVPGLVEKETGDPAEAVFLSLNRDVFESNIVPGAARTFSVNLFNLSAEPVTVQATAIDVSPVDSTRFAAHVQVTPDRFVISAGERRPVRINVNCPDPLADGNKYTRVDFIPVKIGDNTLGTERQEAFTAPVFLLLENVRGERTGLASLGGIQVEVEEREGGFFPRFIVFYQNEGNIHLDPSLELRVIEEADPEGEEGAVLIRPGEEEGFLLRADPTGDLVLPGTEGVVAVASDRPFREGKATYRVEIVLKNGQEKVMQETSIFEFARE